MANELVKAIVVMDEQEAVKITNELIEQGVSANSILADCQAAMEEVGTMFEKQEYFLPELIMGGEIVRQITVIIKPLLVEDQVQGKKKGKVLFGTVFGDIHDIGKDIVIFVLETNNYEVVDLGVDVPIEKFVEMIRNEKPDIVGMSGFLTKTFDAMKDTIAGIKEAGLRDQVKIMIGGGTVTEDVVDYSGADAFGETAMDAVTLANQWMGR